MICADYAYYTQVYGGKDVSASDWAARERNAEAYLDSLTLGRIGDGLPEPVAEKCRMALCAVAECFEQEAKGGEVASEAVGKWSRTFAASGTSPARRRYDAAARYLANTGLLYRGVG